MNMLRLCHCFCLVMLTASVAVAAEMLPCHQHKVGETYNFLLKPSFGPATDRSMTVTNVGADQIEATDAAGRSHTYDTMFNPIKEWSGRTLETKLYFLPECPVTLGEIRTYKDVRLTNTRGDSLEATIVVTVDPQGSDVVVKAGTFKVIRMTATTRYRWSRIGASGSGESKRVSYYSPEQGVVVKTDYQDQYGERYMEELTSFQLPK